MYTATANERKIVPGKTRQIVKSNFAHYGKNFVVFRTGAIVKQIRISVLFIYLIEAKSITTTHQDFIHNFFCLQTKKLRIRTKRFFFFNQRQIFRVVKGTLHFVTAVIKVKKQRVFNSKQIFFSCF